MKPWKYGQQSKRCGFQDSFIAQWKRTLLISSTTIFQEAVDITPWEDREYYITVAYLVRQYPLFSYLLFVLVLFQGRPIIETAGDFAKGLRRRASNAALDVAHKVQGRRMSVLALAMATFFTLLAVLVRLRCDVRLCGACFTCCAECLSDCLWNIKRILIITWYQSNWGGSSISQVFLFLRLFLKHRALLVFVRRWLVNVTGE